MKLKESTIKDFAEANINRKAYGFEIDRKFYKLACENFNKMQDKKLF